MKTRQLADIRLAKVRDASDHGRYIVEYPLHGGPQIYPARGDQAAQTARERVAMRSRLQPRRTQAPVGLPSPCPATSGIVGRSGARACDLDRRLSHASAAPPTAPEPHACRRPRARTRGALPACSLQPAACSLQPAPRREPGVSRMRMRPHPTLRAARPLARDRAGAPRVPRGRWMPARLGADVMHASRAPLGR